MSLLLKRLALTSTLLLTGCGFEPLYAPSTKSNLAVSISLIGDRDGQLLRQYLQHQFTCDVNPLYYLNVTVSKDTEDVGFRRDETARRARITLKATYELRSKDSKSVSFKGQNTIVTGYTQGSQSAISTYPMIVSESDAVQKALKELAHDIHLSVSSYLYIHHQDTIDEGK